MSLLKLTDGFHRLTAEGLLQRSRFIYSRMKGNALFPTPWPAMGNLLSAINDFDKELNATYQSHLHKARMEEKRLALIDILHLVGYYVSFVSGGNADVILMAGFQPLRHKPTNGKPVYKQVFNQKLAPLMRTKWIQAWLIRTATN